MRVKVVKLEDGNLALEFSQEQLNKLELKTWDCVEFEKEGERFTFKKCDYDDVG